MRTLSLFALMLLAAGCASDPIVDMHGVDQEKYDSDLAACREYADQVDVASGAAGGAAIGAAGGAALGAVIGAITGATGGVSGGGSRTSRQDRVVRNCLRERGYSVFD